MSVQAYGCNEKQLRRLQRVCGIREGASPLDRQYLFNVYLHPSSSYKGGRVLVLLSCLCCMTLPPASAARFWDARGGERVCKTSTHQFADTLSGFDRQVIILQGTQKAACSVGERSPIASW